MRKRIAETAPMNVRRILPACHNFCGHSVIVGERGSFSPIRGGERVPVLSRGDGWAMEEEVASVHDKLEGRDKDISTRC